MPDLDQKVSQVRIGPRTVESSVNHKRWKGRSSPFNVRFRVRFRGADPNSDRWYNRCQIPTATNLYSGVHSCLAKVQKSSPESQTLSPAPPVEQPVEAELLEPPRLCHSNIVYVCYVGRNESLSSKP